ncbi:Ger(x)C family spore germination protein [Paucisalibacillus globulus]|uniref:Ger(x)C family spore germination protein n=1 Tax=Paucisalibacillus globulus TaxID=351095 RepID=UPI000423383B|nr:Ger(x)C family spore germination protein [Paucisalibacillus globulus]
MRDYIVIWLGIILLTMLSGCWDEKEIGEVNYATAIGVDYIDDNYVLYVQMLDFTNVAKQETQKVSEDAPLFVGNSSGATLNEAVNNLYKTSQLPFNWGHVGTIVFSETVLEKGIEKIQQAIKRNGEFRYTPWIYGTKKPVEELFSVNGFFHLPPVYTILYKPEDTYKVYSYIKPLRMHNLISIYKSPGGTAVLPSISIDTSSWQRLGSDEKPKETLRINGSFQISEGKYQDWMSYEELTGLRWIQTKTKITPVKIIDDEKIIGAVEITDPTSEIKAVGKDENATFQIHIKAKGKLADLQDDTLNQDQIENLVKKQIKEEIIKTYQKGLEKEIDIYNLKNILFRNGMKPEKLKEIQLSDESLSKITVDFYLESRGLYE